MTEYPFPVLMDTLTEKAIADQLDRPRSRRARCYQGEGFSVSFSHPEPPDAVRAPRQTPLVRRHLGQCFRATRHSRIGNAWLLDNQA